MEATTAGTVDLATLDSTVSLLRHADAAGAASDGVESAQRNHSYTSSSAWTLAQDWSPSPIGTVPSIPRSMTAIYPQCACASLGGLSSKPPTAKRAKRITDNGTSPSLPDTDTRSAASLLSLQAGPELMQSVSSMHANAGIADTSLQAFSSPVDPLHSPMAIENLTTLPPAIAPALLPVIRDALELY